MTKKDEDYMEYVYALERLQQTTSEFEKLEHEKLDCDWSRLAKLLTEANDEINFVMFNADGGKEN